MIVLGIETSGPVGSIALRRDGRCVEERFLPELGRRHAQSLVPETAAFLARHGLEPTAIDAVAVSVGPGSFTGLRVGVTFAKTFAYATGASLIAVETFPAIAGNTPAAESVCVIADAQRRGLMLGNYVRGHDGRFERRGEIRLVTPDELPKCAASARLLTGPGLARVTLGDEWTCRTAPLHLRTPRASLVAELGEFRFRAGNVADVRSLEPLYVRKSAAEEKRDAALGTSSALGMETASPAL
ncbi:MAG: tRNA (adenosine(37)-N6)-threonylcarbamoyltransferase complex dimerization subunit type 1 TsaB [Planctomycetaceae bacterium]